MASKIIIIEDDDQLRSMIRQVLERAEYVVCEAKNGEEGVQVCHDEHPDLVISDLIMPNKDGIMAIQEIKADNPKIRIIAISGGPQGNTAWLPIAKKAGAMQVLKKPFGRQQLLDAVAAVLANPWISWLWIP